MLTLLSILAYNLVMRKHRKDLSMTIIMQEQFIRVTKVTGVIDVLLIVIVVIVTLAI